MGGLPGSAPLDCRLSNGATSPWQCWPLQFPGLVEASLPTANADIGRAQGSPAGDIAARRREPAAAVLDATVAKLLLVIGDNSAPRTNNVEIEPRVGVVHVTPDRPLVWSGVLSTVELLWPADLDDLLSQALSARPGMILSWSSGSAWPWTTWARRAGSARPLRT